MHIANQLYKDMAVMTQSQSEDIEIVHNDLEATEDKIQYSITLNSALIVIYQ